MVTKYFYKIFLFVALFMAVFLVCDFAKANDPGAVCERKNDGLYITVNLKFFQNDLPGGDAELKNVWIPSFTADLMNRYNGFKTGCGEDVKFIFNTDISAGGSAKYPVGDGSWEQAKINGQKCVQENGYKYHCFFVANHGLIVDGLPSDGCVSTDNPWAYESEVTGPDNGYINGNYNNPAFGRTADNNTLSHEVGHLLHLGEEYAADGSWTNASMMGMSSSGQITMQKHIDVITKFLCEGNNIVCRSDPDPRSKCCIDRNKRLPVSFPADVNEAGQCAKEEIHLCPYEKCPGVSTCNAECKCEGDTCEGTCQSTDCDPATQVFGVGSCTSDSTNTKCCKSKSSPPPGGGFIPPSLPPDTPLPGYTIYGDISCIRSGQCSVCDLINIVFNIGIFILKIIGAVTLFFLVYGGFVVLISAGSGDKINQGKNILINSIIGFTLVFSAFALVNLAVWTVTGSTNWWQPRLKCTEPAGATRYSDPSSTPTPAPSPSATPATSACNDGCAAADPRYPHGKCLDKAVTPCVLPDFAEYASPPNPATECVSPEICCCSKNPFP